MAGGVVVVGGGIAGVSTVAELRAGGFDGDLTLVDAGDFPYDRPPLSKEYLAGVKDLADIALQPPRWYSDRSVRLINRTTVTALRPAEGAVELSGGMSLRAERVVLATGGRAARPPIPGSGSPRVHVLRTAEDAWPARGAQARGKGPGGRSWPDRRRGRLDRSPPGLRGDAGRSGVPAPGDGARPGRGGLAA